MLRLALVAVTLVAIGTACEEDGGQPCDRYVDYMCDCHGADPGFDCEELSNVFDDADPTIQDQCSIDLGDQQDEDDETGHECEAAPPA